MNARRSQHASGNWLSPTQLAVVSVPLPSPDRSAPHHHHTADAGNHFSSLDRFTDLPMELGQLFWQSLLAAALRPAKQINRTGQFGLSKQCRASTRPPKIGKFTSTTLPSFNS
jgi:hypothetical protein